MKMVAKAKCEQSGLVLVKMTSRKIETVVVMAEKLPSKTRNLGFARSANSLFMTKIMIENRLIILPTTS